MTKREKGDIWVKTKDGCLFAEITKRLEKLKAKRFQMKFMHNTER